MKLRVATIKCPKCHEIIWSKHRHDYRECKCGEVAIDGGRDYTRTAYHGKTSPKVTNRTIEVRKAALSPKEVELHYLPRLILVRECWPGGAGQGTIKRGHRPASKTPDLQSGNRGAHPRGSRQS